MTDLQVPVNYAIYVTVIYTFYNLLYAVTAEERERAAADREEEEEEEVRKQGRGAGRHNHPHTRSNRTQRHGEGHLMDGSTFGKQRPEGPQNHY